RYTMELLFSARAVVPDSARRAEDVEPGGRAHHRLHRAAADDGCGGVRVSVAAGPCDAASRHPRRRDAAALREGRAAGDWSSRPGGDYRRRDVQLQLVDLVGRIHAELELPQAPGVAIAFDGADEARDPLVDPAAGFGGDRARAEGPERAGAVVLHERPGVRAAVPAAAVRALRLEGQPRRVDRRICRLARLEGRRRRTVAGPAGVHLLS